MKVMMNLNCNYKKESKDYQMALSLNIKQNPNWTQTISYQILILIKNHLFIQKTLNKVN